MTSLILIRHGETDWNRARRIQGSTDIPLNDTGRAQAAARARQLLETLPSGAPVRIASSDLSRARETAEIIATALGIAAPRTYRDLRERNYGEAEGVSIEEFAERWGTWHDADVPGAEARAALRVRALRGLAAAVDDSATSDPDTHVLVVAHGALIREVLGHASDDLLPAAGERLHNGSAQRFVWQDGSPRLVEYAPV